MPYLRQIPSGRIFISTDALAVRPDMQVVSDDEVLRVPHQAPEPDPALDEPAPVAEEQADEPTPHVSVKPVSRMNKDELEIYTLFYHGVDIDKRKALIDLRREVQALDREASGE